MPASVPGIGGGLPMLPAMPPGGPGGHPPIPGLGGPPPQAPPPGLLPPGAIAGPRPMPGLMPPGAPAPPEYVAITQEDGSVLLHIKNPDGSLGPAKKIVTMGGKAAAGQPPV